MSERKGFKPMLAALMGMAGLDPMRMPAAAGKAPTKMRKVHSAPRYKSFFTMGYRGFPKNLTPRGMVPAPTIDQVRFQEREYGQKIHVKMGLMYFANEDRLFSVAEASRRQAEQEHAACTA